MSETCQQTAILYGIAGFYTVLSNFNSKGIYSTKLLTHKPKGVYKNYVHVSSTICKDITSRFPLLVEFFNSTQLF